MAGLVINIILQGILPIVIGTYLVLLSQGKVLPPTKEKAEALAKNKTVVEVMGWLSIAGGFLGILSEVMADKET
jgi:hypothetical protein